MSSVVIRRKKTNTRDEGKKDEDKVFGVYIKSVLDTKVCLAITEIGKNVKQNLENRILVKITGKCISEGYIKPGSVKIVNYSSGNIQSDVVEYHVVFECMVCLPVEGMEIMCKCKTITKAGIHAQVIDEDGNMPVTIFIARDHHHFDDRFQSVKEGDRLKVKVIGIRFELNDEYICAIAKLM
jgi:DNA-directed RNA polymerase subunit E'/Rpb7